MTDATPEPDFLNAVRLAVYSHFAEHGVASSTEQLAHTLHRPPADISAALRGLADQHVLVLDETGDAIRMAMPFSGVPTGFRVTSGASGWWANCAWDALGIAAALERDVDIAAVCGWSGEPLPLRVRDGALHPTPGVAHFAVPAREWWADIGFT